MATSKKGLNPAQVQAPQTAHHGEDMMEANLSTLPSRCPTKLELVALHLLENGTTGTSSLSGLAGLRDLNFRNSVSDLRKMGILILDERFPHQHSGGGVTYMKCYWLADRHQASGVAELVNRKRKVRGAQPMSKEHITRLLAAFPLSVSPVKHGGDEA